MELVLGNRLTMNGRTYQNYSLQAGDFLPFAFSGAVVNRSGDNTQASLVFPNNDLSRPWAAEATASNWIVSVDLFNVAANRVIYNYVGQVAGSSWDETSVQLQLSTVLDAIGADIPFRTIGEDIVGTVPTSSAFRLS